MKKFVFWSGKRSKQTNASRPPLRPIDIQRYNYLLMEAQLQRFINPFLSRPVVAVKSSDDYNKYLKYGVSTMQGWRPTQEDAHLAIIDFRSEISALFAVFDGHNGGEVAEYARRKLPELIRANSNILVQDDRARTVVGLQECFLEFDKSLTNGSVGRELRAIREVIHPQLQVTRLHKPGFDSGTTALVVYVASSTIYIANAGDCRCVLSRRGRPVALSKDHKPEDDSERKRIEKAGGRVMFGRIVVGDVPTLNLSRAFGDYRYKNNPELTPEEQMVVALPSVEVHNMLPGDEFMVLACDGIWNCMSNQEVVTFVKNRIGKHDDVSVISEKLIHNCLAQSPNSKRGAGMDNMTCIIVKLHFYKPIG